MLEGMRDRKTKHLESNEGIFVHERISLFFPLHVNRSKLTLQSLHGPRSFMAPDLSWLQIGL